MRAQWVLALLTLSTLVNYLDRQSLAVVLPAVRQHLSISATDYGLISSVFLIAYSLGQLLAVPLIDRLGIRLSMGLFVAFWSLAAMLHGFAQNTLHLIILRALLGLSEAGNWPAGVKAIALWFPSHRRAFSLGVFDGGAAFGSVLAFPLMSTLTAYYGWRAAFLTLGAIGLVWLSLWLLSVENFAPPSSLPSTPAPLALPSLLSQPTLWALLAVRFFATPVWWFYVFWLPDYLTQQRGFTLEQIGLIGWLPYLTVDLGKWTGGLLSDRLASSRSNSLFARRSVMAAGALLMAAAVFVVDAASAGSAMAWITLGTFGFGLWSVNILALHTDSFHSAQLASAVGITTAASSASGALFTWLTGHIVSSLGYHYAFAGTSLIAIIAYAILHFSFRPSAVR